MIKKIFQNTLFLSVSQVAGRAIGFIYFVFLARTLGVADFGIYSFTLAFIYNFVPVADFGMERLILRDISREPEKAGYYFSRLLPLRVFLSLVSYLLALILGIVLGLPLRELAYLSLFGLALLPYNLAFLAVGFQNAREKMHCLAAANIALVALTGILGVIFVFLKLGLFWVFLAYPLANLILALIIFSRVKKWGLPLGWRFDFRFCREVLSQSWIFAVFTILAVFYLRATVLMIGVFKDPATSGLYNSVFKFVEAGILIPQSLALALFPLSSRLFLKDKTKLKSVYLKALGVLLIVSLPPALILLFLAEPVISLAYGPLYLPAVGVFRILGLSLILFFVNALPGNIIQNSEKVKSFLPFSVAIFLFVFLLSFLLIPRYSLAGAGWAVVGGELFGFIVSNVFILKILRE